MQMLYKQLATGIRLEKFKAELFMWLSKTQITKGIEGLEDVQFDPMKLKEIRVVHDGPVNLNTTITDGVAIGFSNIVAVEN